jgi:6,7-dimethyl-8-ribityllumazine synthase
LKTELNRVPVSAEGMTFAIVVSRWNHEFTSALLAGAQAALAASGADDEHVDVFHVPGAFELPVASANAARTGVYDAVIALGVVVRGDTPHFDYVAGGAADGLMRASTSTGVPVMFGVITADKLEQVRERSGPNEDNKGSEAALSAIETVIALREIKSKGRERSDARANF